MQNSSSGSQLRQLAESHAGDTLLKIERDLLLARIQSGGDMGEDELEADMRRLAEVQRRLEMQSQQAPSKGGVSAAAVPAVPEQLQGICAQVSAAMAPARTRRGDASAALAARLDAIRGATPVTGGDRLRESVESHASNTSAASTAASAAGAQPACAGGGAAERRSSCDERREVAGGGASAVRGLRAGAAKQLRPLAPRKLRAFAPTASAAERAPSGGGRAGLLPSISAPALPSAVGAVGAGFRQGLNTLCKRFSIQSDAGMK